jgi:hypothetical protein
MSYAQTIKVLTEPTPGPWRVEVYKIFGQSETCAVKGEGVLVCWPENPADGPLIAAAWEMREALQMVVDLGETWDRRYSLTIDYIDEIIEAARAALKKAGGGDE